MLDHLIMYPMVIMSQYLFYSFSFFFLIFFVFSIMDVFGFSAKLNPQAPASIKDMAVGVSAALAIRSYMNKMSGGLTVYMTGNVFPKDVADFKVSAFGFQDYNSSDIIISADKKKFFGVSLKKKKDVKAADPTLINKAFSSVFEGKQYDKLKKDLTDMRINYFGGLIKVALK